MSQKITHKYKIILVEKTITQFAVRHSIIEHADDPTNSESGGTEIIGVFDRIEDAQAALDLQRLAHGIRPDQASLDLLERYGLDIEDSGDTNYNFEITHETE